ncbi:hypothetical protein [Streptomyces sp. NPDC002172]
MVVAAGLGSATLLAPHGIHIPLTGVRGRVLITEPVAPTLRRVLTEETVGVPRSWPCRPISPRRAGSYSAVPGIRRTPRSPPT